MFKKILITILLFSLFSTTFAVTINGEEYTQEYLDANPSFANSMWLWDSSSWDWWTTTTSSDSWPTRSTADNKIKDWLLWITEENIINSWEDDWLNVLQSIFIWIKDSLTSLVLLIAVWAFLFIWIRLGIARWNPEEFKKAVMQLVYAVIWIFVISLAWWIVVLVAWLNL